MPALSKTVALTILKYLKEDRTKWIGAIKVHNMIIRKHSISYDRALIDRVLNNLIDKKCVRLTISENGSESLYQFTNDYDDATNAEVASKGRQGRMGAPQNRRATSLLMKVTVALKDQKEELE